MEVVLEKCRVHLSKDEYHEMDRELKEIDIWEVLKLLKNGKSPRLDGIPYEFFKVLDIKFQQSKGTTQEAFDFMTFPCQIIHTHQDTQHYWGHKF
jgi:hypothetical protein